MKACFFSHEPAEQLAREQYSLQDIRILKDIGYDVVIATRFNEIPWGADLYFGWWAAGSVLPLIKAKISCRPIIVVAGGNETMFYKDSITGAPSGYISTKWYKKIATRITLRLSDKILVVSKFMLPDTIALGARNVAVVYNSVDCNKFNADASRRTYAATIFKLDEKVMENKRAENIILAAAIVCKRLPDFKLAIIGEKGSGYEKLRRLITRCEIEQNVTFVGAVKNDEVVAWLRQSRVYIQISDTETFGVAVAEAMSCGCPVVLSRRGALPEVAGDLAIYVDHNSPESVAEGIIRVLGARDEEFQLLAQRSRARIVNNFSYELRRQSIKNIIEEVAG